MRTVDAHPINISLSAATMSFIFLRVTPAARNNTMIQLVRTDGNHADNKRWYFFQIYGSCSCVTGDGFASSIGCSRNACTNLYPFVISIFFCFFSSILTISPSLQITLRCVPFDKRILAISLQVCTWDCECFHFTAPIAVFVNITAHFHSFVGDCAGSVASRCGHGSILCVVGNALRAERILPRV